MRANSGGRVGAADRGRVARDIAAYSGLKSVDAFVADLRGDEVAKVN
jgi:hypothetical protein